MPELLKAFLVGGALAAVLRGPAAAFLTKPKEK